MSTHPIDTALAQINQKLKVAKLGLKVERRGEKLNLRGTLPPRPKSDRIKPYQQRIPLGLKADSDGLKAIEKEAKIVATHLILDTFSWQKYLSPTASTGLSSAYLADQIIAFETHYQQMRKDRSRTDSLRTTWDKAYAPYFRKLLTTASKQPDLTLPEAIYTTVQSTKANSRSRQVCCTALDALATFLDLPMPTPLKSFWGTYGNSKTQLRDLPSDDAIIQAYERIPNPAWQFVYGVMATYGLRNHEVFFCDYSQLTAGDPEALIEVLETSKTGHHDVWPFHSEWVETFSLRTVNLPKINTDLDQTTLQRIGQSVTQQFKRYQLPFSPYDLRHAWAVRTIGAGLPDTVAARMMGHSVAVHTRTYHRWITRRNQRAAVRMAMGR